MLYENLVVTCLHPVYRKMIAPIKRSKALARLIFGIEYVRRTGFAWDWVTLGLRQALKREGLRGHSFLDMGCGKAAILSVFAHTQGCRSLTAVDIVPEFVRSARKCHLRNGIDACVLQSDFGEKLGGQTFDIIAWNSTYIPEKWGKSQGLGGETVAWPGGDDGTVNIRRFLGQMPMFLSKREGKIPLGFNRFYVQPERIQKIINQLRLKVFKHYKLKIGMSSVFVIGGNEK